MTTWKAAEGVILLSPFAGFLICGFVWWSYESAILGAFISLTALWLGYQILAYALGGPRLGWRDLFCSYVDFLR